MTITSDHLELQLELATWNRLLESTTDNESKAFIRLSIASVKKSLAELSACEESCHVR